MNDLHEKGLDIWCVYMIGVRGKVYVGWFNMLLMEIKQGQGEEEEEDQKEVGLIK